LKLCALNDRLREIFTMAGFDRVFEILTTRADAEQAFK
jgi:anti-anti-sigma regulatory factor